MQNVRPIRHTSRSSTRTRIHLDACDAPISVNLEERHARGMVVTQELGCLRLDQAVRDESGREARIAAIRLDTESGTPKLILELEYLDEMPRDPTLGYDDRPHEEDKGVDFAQGVALRGRRRADQPTVVFRTTPEERISTEIATPPWLQESGTELQLAWRETRYKWSAAFAILAHGVTSAITNLRS